MSKGVYYSLDETADATGACRGEVREVPTTDRSGGTHFKYPGVFGRELEGDGQGG